MMTDWLAAILVWISGALVGIYPLQRTSVDVFDRCASQKMIARYGVQVFDHKCSEHWPFEAEHEGRKREKGQLDELPDVVMQIGDIVPKNLPESLRQDLCQDRLCPLTITD